MASFLRRYLIESDLSDVARVSSPYVAGALVGAAAWAFGDACAVTSGGHQHPPALVFLPPLVALFSLFVLALVPRSYLASLDEGGGGVFDTGEGMSASARAKVLLFLAWGCSFGSAAGGVALAATAKDTRASTLASGSLSSTILTLLAGMVLWFGRGDSDSYGEGYYGY